MSTMTLNDDSIRRISDGLTRSLKNAKPFFDVMINEIHQNTMLTFRTEGARSGHPRWKSFNNGKGVKALGSTTRTKAGTWNIRLGSDDRPRRNAVQLKEWKSYLIKKGKWSMYKTGPMPGYENDVRYSASSKLLQSSGSFMRSFGRPSGIWETTDNNMRYGTRYHSKKGVTAKDIIGDREVLFLTEQDHRKIRTDFLAFVKKGLQI